MRSSRFCILSLPLILALAGCGAKLDQPISNQAVSGLSGATFGGEQPILGATVTLWAVGTSGYGAGATKIATAIAATTATGTYSFGTFTCPYSNTPTYLLSSGGNAGGGINAHIVLAAASGACGNLASATVNISEVTTAATAYAMSHFFTTTLGGAYTTDLFGGSATGTDVYNTGLVNADLYTVPTLVNLAAGSSAAARTTVTSGTLTRTFESAKLYNIANILAACVDSNGSTASGTYCGKLFADTTDTGTTAPADTLQAAVQMALYPYTNVSALYTLPPGGSPFVGLAAQPNDWSLAISYTSTDFQLGIFSTPSFRSSSNIDIDAAGNVWFPTNSPTSHGVAYLNPLSSAPTFAGPYLTSLQNPEYLAITNQGRIYAASTTQSDVVYAQTTSPATSGVDAVPSTDYGNNGPLTAAFGNDGGDSVDVTVGGGSNSLGTGGIFVDYTWPSDAAATENNYNNFSVSPVSAQDNGRLATSGSGNNTLCDMEVSERVRVTTGSAPCYAGGIAQVSYNNNLNYQELVQAISSTNGLCDYAPGDSSSGECFTSPVALYYPQGVAVDGLGNVWVANYGNGSVSTLGYSYSSGTHTDFHATSTVPYLHGQNNGGTMINPIGIAIDNSGNVWLSNGCITATSCTPGAFTLSELVGAAAPTLTPLHNAIANNTTGTRPQAITSPVTTQTRAATFRHR